MDVTRSYDFLSGEILLINKPVTWTSFDVVNKIRYALKRILQQKIKVGHAGTLDPLADGLLLIATGKATKRIESLQSESKKYTGTFTLGATTPSFDLETEIDETFPLDHITRADLETARKQFIGKIKQRPPIFSAVKVAGERAYNHARKGNNLLLEKRELEIFDLRISNVDLPHVDFAVHCSKGTYIRSLAYDFGKALKSGAYLSQLTRTAIGKYKIDDAWELMDFIQFVNKQGE